MDYKHLLVLVVHLLLGEGGLGVLLQVAADPVEGVRLLGAAGGGQGLLAEEHHRVKLEFNKGVRGGM